MKWFKHETDAHTNLKLQTVLDKFGLEGYGYYWSCVELVGLQGQNFRIKEAKNWKMYLKKFVGVEAEKQEKFLKLFCDLNLINKKALENGDLFIPKIGERADEYTDKIRRKSRQGRDNVPLEEKRTEQIRREGDITPRDISQKFFSDPSEQNLVIEKLAAGGASEDVARREVEKFINYWTELDQSGKRQRWEKEKTFEVQRRLATWFRNVSQFTKTSNKSNVAIIT